MKRGALLVAGVLLAGCATGTGFSERDRLVTASEEYNSLLRWKELDRSCVTFVTEEGKEACLQRARTLGDLHITDIHVRNIAFGPDGTGATVLAEIEYYLLPSAAVRTVEDRQRWRFLGSGAGSGWRITTPLPDFARP